MAVWIGILAGMMMAAGPAPLRAADPDVFAGVRTRLAADGFDAARLRRIYAAPGVDFETKGLSQYFVHQESKLNYGQFLKPGSVERGTEYLRRHKDYFSAAERDFGVSRYVITAILTVETQLGAFAGTRPVLNILSSMAALKDRPAKERLWKSVAAGTRLTRQEFDAKADQKSGWAYDELKAFLRYTETEGIAPGTVKGSYAGAMGFCQFIPSNIVMLATDGDGDGRINLFSHADAIASVARYLARYGWHSGLSRQQAYQAVYEYNHSRYYVDTVLKLADLLKG